MQLLKNRRLISWEIVLFYVLIAFNLFFAGTAFFALLLRFHLAPISWKYGINVCLKIGSSIVFPLNQVVTLASWVLTTIILFRLRKNSIHLNFGRTPNRFMIVFNWFIPYLSLIYKYFFYRRFIKQAHAFLEIKSRRYQRDLTLALVFSLIGLTLMCVYSFGIYKRESFLSADVIIGLMVMANVFSVIYSMFMLKIFARLRELDYDLQKNTDDIIHVYDGPIDQIS